MAYVNVKEILRRQRKGIMSGFNIVDYSTVRPTFRLQSGEIHR